MVASSSSTVVAAAAAGVTGATGTPSISSLTRNISNLSSNLISHLVSSHHHTSGSAAVVPADTVTLAVPRPENERLTNEYVDTPFLQQQRQTANGSSATTATHLQQHSNTTTPQLSLRPNHSNHGHLNRNGSRTHGGVGASVGVVTSQPTAGSHGPAASLLISDHHVAPVSPHGARKQHLLGRHASNASQVITKQPMSGAKKDLDSGSAAALHSIDKLDRAELSAHLIDGGVMGAGHTVSGAGLSPNGAPSITCPQCEKCRCEGCQKPRQLPSRWLCGKSCLCSAESVLDYATCLCCVKALFYHCSKDHEIDNENGNSISCADDPCSCLPHRRTTRWGCLGALSLCLPCLVCYWPMRGAISLCASCYASQSRKGCRCNSSSGSGNGVGARQHMQLQQQHQMFGRDGPMEGGLRASIGQRGGGNNGRGMMPGVGPKKVYPVHHEEEAAMHRTKLGEVGCKRQIVDCDRAHEEERLTQTTTTTTTTTTLSASGVLVGVLGGNGGGGGINIGGGGPTSTTVCDSDSSSTCGGHLVRTLRLKPTSTSSTSSSQLSLLRHPADETPPRHLLD